MKKFFSNDGLKKVEKGWKRLMNIFQFVIVLISIRK